MKTDQLVYEKLKNFSSLKEFFFSDKSNGVILLTCAHIALTFANSPWKASYLNIWEKQLLGSSLQHWINSGLMTVFFFFVGLEIKQELLIGKLSSLKKASLPLFAALGGMVVPSLIYLLINQNIQTKVGWGIPIATDIAFALGVLAFLEAYVPYTFKVFLTTLAIIDDLGAIFIIALFYTDSLSWVHLSISVILLSLLYKINKIGILKIEIYGILGFLLWSALFHSGVHPTLAGVATALAIPMHCEIIKKIKKKLHPWIGLCIMPLFALSNAGVTLLGKQTLSLLHPVFWGVFLGLLLGKQIGIMLFSYISVQWGLTELPSELKWKHIYAISCLGGIGFTMSFFIAALSFSTECLLTQAKMGAILASLLSAFLGWIILKKTKKYEKV